MFRAVLLATLFVSFFFRICGLSFLYLIAFLATLVSDRLSHLTCIAVACVALLALLGHIAFQSYLGSMRPYADDWDPASETAGIWRQIGFTHLRVDTKHAVRMLYPDILVALVACLLLLRRPGASDAGQRSPAGAQLRRSSPPHPPSDVDSDEEQHVGLAPLASSVAPDRDGTNSTGSKTGSKNSDTSSSRSALSWGRRLKDIVHVSLLWIVGVSLPSVIGAFYLALFGCICIPWALWRRVFFANVLNIVIAGSTACHLLILYLAQMDFFQDNVSTEDMETYGLVAYVNTRTTAHDVDLEYPIFALPWPSWVFLAALFALNAAATLQLVRSAQSLARETSASFSSHRLNASYHRRHQQQQHSQYLQQQQVSDLPLWWDDNDESLSSTSSQVSASRQSSLRSTDSNPPETVILAHAQVEVERSLPPDSFSAGPLQETRFAGNSSSGPALLGTSNPELVPPPSQTQIDEDGEFISPLRPRKQPPLVSETMDTALQAFCFFLGFASNLCLFLWALLYPSWFGLFLLIFSFAGLVMPLDLYLIAFPAIVPISFGWLCFEYVYYINDSPLHDKDLPQLDLQERSLENQALALGLKAFFVCVFCVTSRYRFVTARRRVAFLHHQSMSDAHMAFPSARASLDSHSTSHIRRYVPATSSMSREVAYSQPHPTSSNPGTINSPSASGLQATSLEQHRPFGRSLTSLTLRTLTESPPLLLPAQDSGGEQEDVQQLASGQSSPLEPLSGVVSPQSPAPGFLNPSIRISSVTSPSSAEDHHLSPPVSDTGPLQRSAPSSVALGRTQHDTAPRQLHTLSESSAGGTSTSTRDPPAVSPSSSSAVDGASAPAVQETTWMDKFLWFVHRGAVLLVTGVWLLVRFSLLHAQFVVLFLIYLAALGEVNVLNTIYLLFAIAFWVNPALARPGWVFLLLYAELVILLNYLWGFSPVGGSVDGKLSNILGLDPITHTHIWDTLKWNIAILCLSFVQHLLYARKEFMSLDRQRDANHSRSQSATRASRPNSQPTHHAGEEEPTSDTSVGGPRPDRQGESAVQEAASDGALMDKNLSQRASNWARAAFKVGYQTWIVVVLITLLLCGILGRVTIIKLGYLACFFGYLLLNVLGHRRVLGTWWLILLFASTALVLQYVYQFSDFRERLQAKYPDAALRDIGLETVSGIRGLFAHLAPPTFVLVVCAVHVRILGHERKHRGLSAKSFEELLPAKFQPVFHSSCSFVRRFLAIHSDKFVLLLMFLSAVKPRVSVADSLTVIWTSFFLIFPNLRETVGFLSLFWMQLLLLAKLAFQLESVVIPSDRVEEVAWAGFYKFGANSPGSMVQYYLLTIVALVVYRVSSRRAEGVWNKTPGQFGHAIALIAHLAFQPRSRKVEHSQKRLFEKDTRDGSLLATLKFHVNYFFVLVGHEICCIALLVNAFIRLNFFGLCYFAMLGVLLASYKRVVRALWRTLVVLQSLFVAFQYLETLGYPPGYSYPYATWANAGAGPNQDGPNFWRKGILRWFFLPPLSDQVVFGNPDVGILSRTPGSWDSATVVYADFVLVFLCSCMLHISLPAPVFQRVTMRKGPNFADTSTASQALGWLRRLKTQLLIAYPWLAMLLMMCAGLARLDVFCIGYLAISAVYLYNFKKTFSRRQTRSRFWRWAVWYCYAVLLIKIAWTLPAVTIAFGSDSDGSLISAIISASPTNNASIVLDAVGAFGLRYGLDIRLAPTDNKISPWRAGEGLLFDVITLILVIFQRRALLSPDIEEIAKEFRQEQVLAMLRGRRVVYNRLRIIQAITEQENAKLEHVRRLLEHIRSRQELIEDVRFRRINGALLLANLRGSQYLNVGPHRLNRRHPRAPRALSLPHAHPQDPGCEAVAARPSLAQGAQSAVWVHGCRQPSAPSAEYNVVRSGPAPDPNGRCKAQPPAAHLLGAIEAEASC